MIKQRKKGLNHYRMQIRPVGFRLFLLGCLLCGAFPVGAASVPDGQSSGDTAQIVSTANGTGLTGTVGTSSPEEEVSNLVLIGDDVFNGMHAVLGDDPDSGEVVIKQDKQEASYVSWICADGKGLTWLRDTALGDGSADVRSGSAVVISIGLNECADISQADAYAEWLNEQAFSWNDVYGVYCVSVMPVDETRYHAHVNSRIEAWNNEVRAHLSGDIHYIDAYHALYSVFQTRQDGVHYTDGSCRALYDYIVKQIGLKTPEEKAAERAASEHTAVDASNGWGTDKDGYRVYYDTGRNMLRNTWKTIDGAVYYFDNVGHYLTGIQKIDGAVYAFNDAGMRQSGWFTDHSGHRMRFGSDGKRLYGWQKDGSNNRYYIGKSGWCLTGWYRIGHDTFYFSDSGAAATGKKQIGSYTYLFDTEGAMQVGWHTLDGGTYYFDDQGHMATGSTLIDDRHYYFGTNGVRQTGWTKENAGIRYYTSDGSMLTGVQILDGHRYLFNAEGLMQIGWTSDSQGRRFYYGEDGVMQTGWHQFGQDRYYFGRDGIMRTDWQTINGSRYYFGQNGVMRVGWMEIDGRRYCLGADGRLQTQPQSDGAYFYLLRRDGSVRFTLSYVRLKRMAAVILLAVAVILVLRKKHAAAKTDKS